MATSAFVPILTIHFPLWPRHPRVVVMWLCRERQLLLMLVLWPHRVLQWLIVVSYFDDFFFWAKVNLFQEPYIFEDKISKKFPIVCIHYKKTLDFSKDMQLIFDQIKSILFKNSIFCLFVLIWASRSAILWLNTSLILLACPTWRLAQKCPERTTLSSHCPGSKGWWSCESATSLLP